MSRTDDFVQACARPFPAGEGRCIGNLSSTASSAAIAILPLPFIPSRCPHPTTSRSETDRSDLSSGHEHQQPAIATSMSILSLQLTIRCVLECDLCPLMMAIPNATWLFSFREHNSTQLHVIPCRLHGSCTWCICLK